MLNSIIVEGTITSTVIEYDNTIETCRFTLSTPDGCLPCICFAPKLIDSLSGVGDAPIRIVGRLKDIDNETCPEIRIHVISFAYL